MVHDIIAPNKGRITNPVALLERAILISDPYRNTASIYPAGKTDEHAAQIAFALPPKIISNTTLNKRTCRRIFYIVFRISK